MANKLDKKPERLMQIERFLSQTKVMIILLAVADLFFFFAGHFFYNSIMKLPMILKDLDNPGKYINIWNIFHDSNQQTVPDFIIELVKKLDSKEQVAVEHILVEIIRLREE